MTSDEQMNYVRQAAAFQTRLQRTLRALSDLESSRRQLSGLQWSCPAGVDVTAGMNLTSHGLLEQALRDIEDAQALTDLALSGEAGPAAEVEPEPEPEPAAENPLDYDWPEDTVNLSAAAFGWIIQRHIDHAIEKHPLFAHETHNPHADYRSEAAGMQQSVEGQIEAGKVYADSLLLEEVYEFLAEVKDGNLIAAKGEAGDVAAVLYRIIQMMEARL